MINIPITYNRQEFNGFASGIQVLFNLTVNLNANDYYHYYNIRSLSKKILDKKFRLIHNKQKKITIPININEFESIKYVYNFFNSNLFDYAMTNSELNYNSIMILDVIARLDKKQKSLLQEGFLLSIT